MLRVADGMGGMAAGEVASQGAICTLINLALATPDWVLKKGKPEIDRVMQRMAERYRRVSEALREEARADARLSGMGTTLTLSLRTWAIRVLTLCITANCIG
jgi:serine/threonine protein phosphatase PrpC